MYQIFIISVIFFLISSCNLNRKVFSNFSDNLIEISINDFSKNCRLFKKDSVFFVFESQSNNKNERIVTIIKNNTKILKTKKVIVGSKGNAPSRFKDINGKLFFWWDDNIELSEEALAIFERKNLLQDDKGGWVAFPDSVIDETQKGASYHFCKGNYKVFKRVITNVAVNYYKHPKLKCN